MPLEPPYGATTVVRLLEAVASGGVWIVYTLDLLEECVCVREPLRERRPLRPAVARSADQATKD